jgi:hypothetical protein
MAEMPGWLAEEMEGARAERADALAAVGLQDTAAPGARDRVNEVVDATIDGWMAKGGRSCSHLADPVPAYLPFGNRRVMCSMCLDFYQAGITGTDADRRCDLCGEKILTPTLAPLMVEVGPFTVMGGACASCRDVDD